MRCARSWRKTTPPGLALSKHVQAYLLCNVNPGIKKKMLRTVITVTGEYHFSRQLSLITLLFGGRPQSSQNHGRVAFLTLLEAVLCTKELLPRRKTVKDPRPIPTA